MKLIYKSLTLLLLFLTFVVPVMALDLSLPNNKFGIHLAQPNPDDLEKAAALVNANGGKWGYITLVIQENDRDRQKWQEVFDRLRELHLIPLIRIATKPESGKWKRPQKEDVEEWVNFLTSLNWVVKDKYIILFNEPNHAAEWGGAVDPEGFARITKLFAQKLKEKSKDFFIMMAGFDASAPSSAPYYEDEENFIRSVLNVIPSSDFNSLFSGWVSHSYPNPAFAGPPTGNGRGTVRTYKWELQLLKDLGIKEMPVFITETGWDADRIARDQIASNFKTSFEAVWLPDDDVTAVTPFVFSYLGEPFDNFSWIKPDNNDYYPQYQTVQDMPKEAGSPEIVDKGGISYDAPGDMVADSTYRFKITLKNAGQAIWDKGEGYRMEITGSELVEVKFSDIDKIKPNTQKTIEVIVKTDKKLGKGKGKIYLTRENGSGRKRVLNGNNWSFKVGTLPSFDFKVSFFPKLRSQADNTEIQIFDSEEELVYKRRNVKISKGKGTVEGVSNIVLGKKYRVVMLKPSYLPRQTHVTFQEGANTAKFETMLPVDFNKDGKFDMADIQKLSGNWKLLSVMLP